MYGRINWAELFLSAGGRLARTPFVVTAAALLMLVLVYQAVMHPTLHWLTGWFVYPALIYAATCLLSKRLHDRGRSGWWAAPIIVALIAIWPAPSGFFDFLFGILLLWAAVELCLMAGERGTNRFGFNPAKPPATAI